MYLTKYLVFFELNSSKTLLINSLSGAVDKIFYDIAANLRKVQQKGDQKIDFKIEPDIEDHLKERGYLFETLQDEENFFLAIYEKSKEIYAQRPVKFVISLNSSSQMRFNHRDVIKSGIRLG